MPSNTALTPGAIATIDQRFNNSYFAVASTTMTRIPVSAMNQFASGKLQQKHQKMAIKRPTTARAQGTSMSAVAADPFDGLPSDSNPGIN